MGNQRNDREHIGKDAQFARSGVLFLYAVKAGRFCKIGITGNLKQRLDMYKVRCPFPARLAFYAEVPAGRATYIERLAHQLLAGLRVHGEWFAASKSQAMFAIIRAKEMHQRPEAFQPYGPFAWEQPSFVEAV